MRRPAVPRLQLVVRKHTARVRISLCRARQEGQVGSKHCEMSSKHAQELFVAQKSGVHAQHDLHDVSAKGEMKFLFIFQNIIFGAIHALLRS
jgi:hypothetical protein